MQQEIKRNTPRDVFLHLLSVVTLYWSSVVFITLLWQFINYFFQSNLDFIYYDRFSSLIRFSVSSLFIVFPVFILVSWYLNKIYSKEAEVRESKIRKWLIYLTLFITALVVVVDLVVVINNLLGGETTVKFILKAISVLLVAGFIFAYYLDDVRRETPTKLAKHFAWVSGVIILIAIIGSFFIIGSPATARLLQFDDQKINNLTNIQYQIVNYWQAKEKLPSSLSALEDSISGFTVPTDPQTGASYEYIIVDADKLSFELCADFNKESRSIQAGYDFSGMSENWNHINGRVCFERTIDKDLYPINAKAIK